MRRHHQCPCTCACHGVHRAGISSVYAAPVQVLEYFAPAPVACAALLRLQQVVSILSLSCPPSTLSRVVEYIAPAPAVLLHQILASKKLGKGHAAEIYGKLSFSAGQLFGRFGRMHLAPFKLRQCGRNGCSHLTAEIERAIAFWLHVLPRGPFRAVPPHSGTPFVITMSDGEGTGSVAAAIWSPLAPGGVHQPRWFQLDLPLAALHAWSEGKELEPQRHSTKSRPSSLQSVFVRGPTSFAVPTTIVLWPALSPGAQKAAL